MNWAGAVSSVMREHGAYVLLGLLTLVLALFLWVIGLHVKLGRLSRRKSLIQQSLDSNLLESLKQGLAEVQSNSERVAALSENQEVLASRQASCVQKTGIVRFNAFNDIGGEQSFALALLDAGNNGVLLSSLLSRTESRTYAKTITGGRSEQVLSQEEQQALSRAIKT